MAASGAHMTPYDVPIEDDIGRPVLDGRNGGEESMMSFIRHHILATLQPHAESLRELRQDVQHLAKDLALTDGKVEEQRMRVERVDHDVIGLRSTANSIQSMMNQHQHRMDKEAEVRSKVESDVDASNLGLAKANERHQHCMATVESLDRKLAHLNANFMNLKGVVIKAEEHIDATEKNLLMLKDSHEDLTTRHSTAAAKLQQSSEYGEASGRELQRLLVAYNHHCEEMSVTIEDLDQRARKNQALLETTVDLTDKDRAEQKQLGGFVASMRNCLGHNGNMCMRLDSMQSRDDETHQALEKLHEAFQRLQKLAEQASGSSSGPEPSGSKSSSGGAVFSGGNELVNLLRVKVETLENNSEKMGGTQVKHIEQIKDMIMSIERLQRDGRRLKEYADSTYQELAGLVTAHKQAGARMDSHAIDHNRLQSDLNFFGKEIDGGLKQVKNDLGATSQHLSRLRTHVDGHNTNMFGLAKGFQDAGRHVIASGAGSAAMTARSPQERAGGELALRAPRGASGQVGAETMMRPSALP